MLVKIKGSALLGINAININVEVNVSMGQGYTLVGLPDSSVKESLHRTESAIKSIGLYMPRTKLLVNLSPAEIKKSGAAFDLPITIGVLAASEQLICHLKLEEYIIMGELGLDGRLYPIKGVLAMAQQAKLEKLKGIILPYENIEEASLVEGIKVYGFQSLAEILNFFRDPVAYIEPALTNRKKSSSSNSPLFTEIKGQAILKRALIVACAGNHNILFVGPPGSGKSMLAKSIVSIMPPMSTKEAIETTKIYSYQNAYQFEQGLKYDRPFRAPHHSITDIALVGGGSNSHPGEISLAHNGVLFLDELPEFNRAVIEVLRQPMEDGYVQIARAQQSLQFPSRFLLIAAMNPCPCGYKYHPNGKCKCHDAKVHQYFNKISGPLLDRIDLQIMVLPVSYLELKMEQQEQRPLAEYIKMIQEARNIQFKRFEQEDNCFTNAQMSSTHLKAFCIIDKTSEKLLEKAMNKYHLSARAYTRILKVARTIADLDNSEMIQYKHLMEAIGYRQLDKNDESKGLP